jgi:hypothetical protein
VVSRSKQPAKSRRGASGLEQTYALVAQYLEAAGQQQQSDETRMCGRHKICKCLQYLY